MSAAPRPSGAFLAFLSGVLGAVALTTAWDAFGTEPLPTAPWLAAVALLAAGAAASGLTTGGFRYVPQYGARELVGLGATAAGFVAAVLLGDVQVLGTPVRGWELVLGVIAAYGFFLGSQRSFLMQAALNAFVLFSALAVRPSFAPAALFIGGTLILFAALAVREAAEEAGSPERAPRLRTPLAAGTGAALVLLALFGILYFAHPAPAASPSGDPFETLWNPRRRPGLPTGPALTEVPLPGLIPAPSRPRAPGAEPDESTHLSFGQDLKFGDVATDLAAREVVALMAQLRDAKGRILSPRDQPLYWKMGVVTVYDGRGWTPSEERWRTVRDADDGARDGWVRFAPAGPNAVEQRFIVSPLASRSLFALYPLRAVQLPEVRLDAEGTAARSARFSGRFKYVVVSSPLPAVPEGLDKAAPGRLDARYVHVPPEVLRDPHFVRAAQEVGAGRTPIGRVRAALHFLERFHYTVRPDFPAGVDPTLEFLKRRRGYCQHFASAATLLLRRHGIPARIALGFAGGDWDEESQAFLIRRRHAHSWIEVHFEGLGWVPFDPAAGPADEFLRAPTRGGPTRIEPATPLPDPAPLPAPEPDPSPARPPAPPPPPPVPTPPSGSTPPGPAPDPPRPDPPPPPIEPAPPPARPDPGDARPARSASFERLWEGLENAPAGEAAAASSGGPERSPRFVAGEEGGGDFSSVGRRVAAIVRDLVLVLAAAAALLMLLQKLIARPARGSGPKRNLREGGLWGDPEAAQGADEAIESALPRGSRRRALVSLYVKFLDKLSGLGLRRSETQTGREFALSLERTLAPCPPEVRELTAFFEDVRYGGLEPSDEQVARFKDAFRRALKDIKRSR